MSNFPNFSDIVISSDQPCRTLKAEFYPNEYVHVLITKLHDEQMNYIKQQFEEIKAMLGPYTIRLGE